MKKKRAKNRTKKLVAKRRPKRPLRTLAAARKRLKEQTTEVQLMMPDHVIRFLNGVALLSKVPVDAVCNVFLAAEIHSRMGKAA